MNIRFRLATLTLFIFSCSNANAENSSRLNLDFIQGGARTNVPTILSDNDKYPPGKYLVTIYFNRERLGQQLLDISDMDKNNLCLTDEWITTANLPLRLDKFSAYKNSERQCYEIGKFPDAQVVFDYGAQALKFSIPQVAIRDSLSFDNWDYGIPGFRLAYNGNASKTLNNKEQLYGSVDFNANMGRWVLAAVTNGYTGQGFTTQEATLSTAIGPARGLFLVGKSQTSTSMLPAFSFYGIAMRSDRKMTPWALRGYAPIISGVASSNARVTVRQNGYILSSQIVPPGAYSLNDIRPTGNGELTVTVEEEDGSTTVRSYPVTTLPTLLRAGDFNYNLVTGRRTDSAGKHPLPGIFALLNGDYGFEPVTLNATSILHEKYQSAGMGLTKDLGMVGAVSSNVNLSRSAFNRNMKRPAETYNGASVVLQYARSMGEMANLQLLGYRYTGKNYVDFSNFEPDREFINSNKKNRYEAIITQNLSGGFVNAMGWVQTNRDHGSDRGMTFSYSTLIKQVSLSVNASYSKYFYYSQDDYSTSLNISIPFSSFSRPYYSNSSVSYTRGNGTSFNTGVSGNLNDRVNFGVNTGTSKHSASASAYAGIAFEPVQTGMSISQNRQQTSMSVSAAGSVIGTAPTGLLFVRQQDTTMAVVKLRDVEGIKFNGSTPTNRKGNTALYMNPYMSNDIRIDTENLPDNVELMNSVYNIVPTERAIVYRDFQYADVKRYILRVVDRNGQPLVAGSLAKTEQGVEAGFIANGGILLMSTLSEPKTITVQQQNGQTCRFAMAGMVPGENKTIGVRCE